MIKVTSQKGIVYINKNNIAYITYNSDFYVQCTEIHLSNKSIITTDQSPEEIVSLIDKNNINVIKQLNKKITTKNKDKKEPHKPTVVPPPIPKSSSME